MKPISRREALGCIGGAAGLLAAWPAAAKSTTDPRGLIGIGMHSYGFQWRAAKQDRKTAKFHDALTFLEYASVLGAAGVQVAIGDHDRAHARRIKYLANKLEMYFEAQFQLPKDETDLIRFERDVRLARDADATVFRTACLSGRRYETFKSSEEFRDFSTQTVNSIRLAEPILKRHRLRVAIENHKDWLVPELLEIVRRFSSEWIGICVDTGNSIALMEGAMQVIEAYAPFAFSVHLKDMAVADSPEGFLLSEVPLGRGYLPIPQIVQTLRKANPKVQLNLEMITRDPLTVPCLTDLYWAAMPNMPAAQFAKSLATAKAHASKEPLPRTTGLKPADQLELEDQHVRASLAWARSHLS
jgi:sugar phosphate isomerase/epimerase